MKTKFYFGTSPKRERCKFIKELPFALYPNGFIILKNGGSEYQISIIKTNIETQTIEVYLKDYNN